MKEYDHKKLDPPSLKLRTGRKKMTEYNHSKIENKWAKEWETKKIYQAKDLSKKPKYYSLIEFPYPSGDGLHVGHPRPYIGMDVISRKRRLQGFNVLYPIGWDAFGLPTENYAIKTGLDPRVVTKKNTDTYRRQIKSLGISFDWVREINTSDPKYYKWTQWIFLQFLKKGLAYKAKMTVNWCPKDKTGLANEEVINGRCERCGTPVVKKEKEEWLLAITKYAERLDKDLDTVDYLPHIKLAQRNWIGRSEGAEIEFKISAASNSVKVFTTRPDTIFGATFLAISSEVAKTWLNSGWPASDAVKKYIKKTLAERMKGGFEEKEKTGISAGFGAINPATKKEIPVWIVNYVLGDVGTGAIMGVPAHDERDYEFAKKYKLPIKAVIEAVFTDNPKENEPLVEREAVHAIIKHWSENKFLVLRWKQVNWVTFVTGGVDDGETPLEAVTREIQEETGYQNLVLKEELPRSHSKFYHAPKKENRYAHFSNFYFQLKNGEKKELTEDENAKHEIAWVAGDELEKIMNIEGSLHDWRLLQGKVIAYVGSGILVNSGKFDGTDSEKAKKEITKFVGGKMVTKFKLRDWIFSRQRYWGEPIPVINCPVCGLVPVPESDLPVELPKVKNYQPTESGESPLAKVSAWVNVKCPKCGGKAKRETDTMPNWAGSSWYYLRYADTKNSKEFASQKNLKYWTPVDWYNGGNEHTTLHLLYSRFWHKFLYDLKLVPTIEPYLKRTSHGLILAEGGEKMSKSKGNVINPDDIVKIYGADTLRVYEMFMGPFNQAIEWSEAAIIGPRRFLEKVWRIALHLQKNFVAPPASGFPRERNFSVPASLSKLLHKTIKKVSEDIEEMHFNTAISAMMILANEMEKAEHVPQEDYKKFLQILSPFAPHITEELWNMFGENKSINLSAWPVWDVDAITDVEVKIAVQINGKVRAEIIIQADDDEEKVKNKAFKNMIVLKYIAGKDIKKVIYIKNRLINIVM